MRRYALGIAAAVILCLPGLAAASASLLGPTGLVLTPTAEVLGLSQWNIGVAGLSSDDETDTTIVYGNLGVLPGQRMEVGISREQVDDEEADALVSAKLVILRPPLGRISVAAGVMDITDEVERSPYLVLTHTLGAGVLTRVGPVTMPQVHVGVGGGRLDGLFCGASTSISGRLGLMAEYDGEHVNVGARLQLVSELEATVVALDGLENLGAALSFSSPW